MTEQFHTIAARGVRLTLDLEVGHIRAFEIERGGRTLTPLHTAPWVDGPGDRRRSRDPAEPEIPVRRLLLRALRTSDVENTPPHGWPANARWDVARHGESAATASTRALRARPSRDGRPSHQGDHAPRRPSLRLSAPHLRGRLTARVSAASHGMTRFSEHGTTVLLAEGLRRPPGYAAGDPTRRAAGRCFAHPARFTDLSKLPLADGGTADLHRLPGRRRPRGFRHAGRGEGLAARLDGGGARPDDRDIVLSLKNPADYPGDVPLVLERRPLLSAVEQPPPRRARHRGGARLVGLRPRGLDRAEPADPRPASRRR